MPNKPLLLLDVDGVLNPYMRTPPYDPFIEYVIQADLHETSIMRREDSERFGTRVFLDRKGHRSMILELMEHYEVRWCTYWEEYAHKILVPFYDIPMLEWYRLPVLNPLGPWVNCYLKTPVIYHHLDQDEEQDRTVVWVDDEAYDEIDGATLREQGCPNFYVENTNPSVGLTQETVTRLIEKVS